MTWDLNQALEYTPRDKFKVVARSEDIVHPPRLPEWQRSGFNAVQVSKDASIDVILF